MIQTIIILVVTGLFLYLIVLGASINKTSEELALNDEEQSEYIQLYELFKKLKKDKKEMKEYCRDIKFLDESKAEKVGKELMKNLNDEQRKAYLKLANNRLSKFEPMYKNEYYWNNLLTRYIYCLVAMYKEDAIIDYVRENCN